MSGRKDMCRVYLITTEHLDKGLWFLDEADFVAGMNFLAINAFQSKVTVLAFILMSNHLHIIVQGDYDDVVLFIERLKGCHSRYLHNKYGFKEYLRRSGVDVREVENKNESIERAVAYVQMNCVAANICSHPTQYQWGTGNLFFNPTKASGLSLKDLSKRRRIRILHSCADNIPLDWKIGREGYILPESYVNREYVEYLFRTPNRMDYFLRNSSKARKALEMAEHHLPAFKDQVIVQTLPDLCRSLFQKERFEELSEQEKSEYLRQIRYRFSSNVNQIARILGLTYGEAAKFLDSFRG